MKEAIKRGFNFGLTSGVITTLGLIVGLAYSTQSRVAVVGGIITIAIADSLSDALGIHITEESQNDKSEKQIWGATLSTAFYKFIVALTFLIPVLLLPLFYAIVVSTVWGVGLISYLSIEIAKKRGMPEWKIIGEHIIILVAVIIITFYLGLWINRIFI